MPWRGEAQYPQSCRFPHSQAAQCACGEHRKLSQARRPTSQEGSEILPGELHLGASARAASGVSWPFVIPIIRSLLVVVSELNVFRPFSGPYKTNTKLVVDTDRVLTGPVGFQRLQMIARWNFQIPKFRGCVQISQLP